MKVFYMYLATSQFKDHMNPFKELELFLIITETQFTQYHWSCCCILGIVLMVTAVCFYQTMKSKSSTKNMLTLKILFTITSLLLLSCIFMGYLQLQCCRHTLWFNNINSNNWTLCLYFDLKGILSM
jgi:RsiW-degrading membrane proteinase PrsW (M82 family)